MSPIVRSPPPHSQAPHSKARVPPPAHPTLIWDDCGKAIGGIPACIQYVCTVQVPPPKGWERGVFDRDPPPPPPATGICARPPPATRSAPPARCGCELRTNGSFRCPPAPAVAHAGWDVWPTPLLWTVNARRWEGGGVHEWEGESGSGGDGDCVRSGRAALWRAGHKLTRRPRWPLVGRGG